RPSARYRNPKSRNGGRSLRPRTSRASDKEPLMLAALFPAAGEMMPQHAERTDRAAATRNGAVTASAPQTSARPRDSVSSKGPMASTILSIVIADTNAIVLPTSNAHHAQGSPRRNAVTAMALASSPNKKQ